MLTTNQIRTHIAEIAADTSQQDFDPKAPAIPDATKARTLLDMQLHDIRQVVRSLIQDCYEDLPHEQQ